MLLNLRRAVLISIAFFVLLGLAYPLAETGIGQALFSHNANGSIGKNGSSLVGQQWSGPQWFHGRADSDDPMVTGGSNLGPRSKALVDAVKKEKAALQKQGVAISSNLVTTSGSGVDPDITPADAYAQVANVASARHLPTQQVRQLVDEHKNGPQYGFLGNSTVNVLELNEALVGLR